MIEMFFRRRQALGLALATPAGPYLDGFVAQLVRQGYERWTLRKRVRGAVHFSFWSKSTGVGLEHVHEDALPAFRTHLRSCSCPGNLRRSHHADVATVAGARALVQYLREQGVVRSRPPSSTLPLEPVLLEGFKAWMQQNRGLKEVTVQGYGRVIRDALETLGSSPSDYSAKALRAFVLKRTATASRSAGMNVVTTMRSFLRYLIAQGHCRSGMDGAIPTVAIWRLASLPRYLPAAEINRIIDACDRSTPVGLRDRALLLLLARLGLRSGDVRALEIGDIDWRHANVRVAGKSRCEMKLPLTQEVGDAVLEYLSQGRPPADTERLFLRVLAPWKPLAASSVSALVDRAMLRAGVESRSRGAHVLRHSAATEMLRQGATLEQIGAVLRHKFLHTTAHYSKVDVQRLGRIALPWVEVEEC